MLLYRAEQKRFLTDTATCSDGTKLEAGRFYRGLEEKLAIAQRARNKTQVKTLHAKIANRRERRIAQV